MVTPNKYRFLLGMSPDTTNNLVTNGTFTGSLAGWTVSAGTFWTSVANTAECVGSGAIAGADFAKCKLTQSNIVNPGDYYYLSYDLKKATAGSATNNGRVSFSVGGLYYSPWQDYDENATAAFVSQVHELVFCGQGNNFEFFCQAFNNTDNCAIDNVLLYRYDWNSPLTYEPVNWDAAKITKKRDEVLNGLIVNYIADLEFIEDGYDYLYSKYLSDGFCGEVPVRIEVYNSILGLYEEFFEGFIFINQCTFNTTKRQVKANILDSNASKIFVDNSNVKVVPIREASFSTPVPYPTNYPTAGPYPLKSVNIPDDTGVYGTACSGTILAFNVGILLRKIVLVSTDYRLDFDSDFFSSTIYPPATFANFCITPGYYLQDLQGGGVLNDSKLFKISMKELFVELNKLFNLSFSIDNSTVIPVVKIEPKINYLSATPVLTLNYVNNLQFNFDEKNTVKTINIGYEFVDDSLLGDGANTPDGLQYKTDNLCAKNELNLVSKYIQYSPLIKKLSIPCPAVITHTKYENTWVWIEVETNGNAKSTGPTFTLNYNIDEDDNMLRHVETLQGTVFQATNLTPDIITKSNAALPIIYSFDFPLTKAQFDLIVQAYNTIEFNTDGTGLTTKEGYLLESEFSIKTGLTEFKLLTS